MGFTGKSAKTFFDLLVKHSVKRVVDTRRHNKSQLAGFTKGKDLDYFLSKIGSIQYQHNLDYAPSSDLLKKYRKKMIDWEQYEKAYLKEIKGRNILDRVKQDELENTCFLCSEATADHCHRRVLTEYLVSNFPDLKIIHL